ncbi:MAG: hypothetical protein AUG51_24110 [Acidobacteria bacterium 13_1_20CM_3_53_8]|nr:MAG: hypothetical protein AUG51_24110 [Acidobacteria bacterium 13_1_20CM_3_53_8]
MQTPEASQSESASPDVTNESIPEPEKEESKATSKRKRVPKGAAPPALSLDEAAEIITRFYEEAGGEASYDPLSSIMGNSSASSVFTKKMAALRNYGLIMDENRFVTLTPLGFHVAAPHDPADRVEALKEAFVENEIFARAYERYKGRILPQDEYLVNAFAVWVPKELASEWMEKFKSSAGIAGLLEERNGKLQVRESPKKPEPETEEPAPTKPQEELPQLLPQINTQPQAIQSQPVLRSESSYDVLIRILSPDMEEAEQEAVWTLIRFLKKQEAK